MDFGNLSSLFSGLFISCIGMGFFLYGKKAAKLWPLLAGIALCVYPFFIGSVMLMWLLAAAIIVGVYLLREK
jgi:hypothetical protein